MFQPGQSFGKFYLVQLIGEGGTSRIFKALQQPISRLVALKIPSFAQSGTLLTPDEFLSEATLMARLDHGHVVRIYDFGVHEDSAFICMEYVDGCSLQELNEARGPLSVSAALAVGLQTLEGLLHSHSQGVLHLDLSPANVLVAKSGTVKLSDFGMAGKKRGASGGRIVGTPAFLSPEHVAGEPGTPQSDLFSFASLLYYAATGSPLFDPGDRNEKVAEALEQIRTARESPPESRIKRLPGLLAAPVATALRSLDPVLLSRELQEAWRKVEGDESPEAVLRRELDRHASGWESQGEGPPPSGEELRDRYLGLRESGKHREAVALLEKALRSQPDSPVLRELLAMPPGKAKSAPVTVDVGEPARLTRPAAEPPGSGLPAAPAKRPGTRRLAGAALGILTVTLGILAWNRIGDGAIPPEAGPGETVSPISLVGEPGGAVSKAVAVSPAEAASAAKAVSAAMGTRAARQPARGSDGLASAEPDGFAATEQDGIGSPGALGKSSVAPTSPKTGKSATAGPRPPALAVIGAYGTRVSVNDTVEWVSPSPRNGWNISPGLVNITLAPPGTQRAISSSLFVSPDTLYVLSLEEDGGFSVTRRKR